MATTHNKGPRIHGVNPEAFYDDLTHYHVAEPGDIAITKDGAFRFVQFKDAVAYAEGQLVCWAGEHAVTNDRAGGSMLTGARPAGVVLGAPTQNQYGWVQISGPVDILGTGIAAGAHVKPHASTDGAVTTGTDGTDGNFCGVALAASGTTTTRVNLEGLL